MIRRPVLICLLACVCAASSCTDDRRSAGNDDSSVTELPEPSGRNLPALGEELLVALAQAKNHHHKADIYLKEARLDDAIASIREIAGIPFPQGAPEAEDVRLDARARLAKLLVAQGKVDEAMTVVSQGIAMATRQSFFLANLYTVKGEVHEAMANLLDDDQGAEERARAARRDAIEAFDRSIAINTELQEALMNQGEP